MWIWYLSRRTEERSTKDGNACSKYLLRGKKSNLPFEKGILCGLKARVELQQDLEDAGYRYFLTSKANSDCVENFFSCLR